MNKIKKWLLFKFGHDCKKYRKAPVKTTLWKAWSEYHAPVLITPCHEDDPVEIVQCEVCECWERTNVQV